MSEDDTALPFALEALAKRHNRADFCCGIAPLDIYIKAQASQDAKRHVAAPIVAVASNNTVIGYYTLSAFSINLAALPHEQAKKLPKYPTVPATLLGRLTVDQTQHGRGVGELLLMDALSRSYRNTPQIASYAVTVSVASS